MKKLKFRVVFFFVIFSNSSFAQRAIDVFNPSVPIAWLGLDFTNARFIGDYYEFPTVQDARNLMSALEELITKERDKYDVAQMLGRERAIFRLDITKAHNNALDVASLLADSTGQHNHVRKTDIESIVRNYNFKGMKGLGVMFNVETFNKEKSKALIWVTFVNMTTREVIFTEQLEEEPSGFGIRNFWAGSIYRVIGRVQKKELKKWQLQYSNK